MAAFLIYTNSANKAKGNCHVEIPAPNVAIVSETPNNTGMSVCNAFEDLVPQVCEVFGLCLDHLIWIEHWGKWSVAEGAPYDRDEEEYTQVLFDIESGRACNPRWRYLGSDRTALAGLLRQARDLAQVPRSGSAIARSDEAY